MLLSFLGGSPCIPSASPSEPIRCTPSFEIVAVDTPEHTQQSVQKMSEVQLAGNCPQTSVGNCPQTSVGSCPQTSVANCLREDVPASSYVQPGSTQNLPRVEVVVLPGEGVVKQCEPNARGESDAMSRMPTRLDDKRCLLEYEQIPYCIQNLVFLAASILSILFSVFPSSNLFTNSSRIW